MTVRTSARNQLTVRVDSACTATGLESWTHTLADLCLGSRSWRRGAYGGSWRCLGSGPLPSSCLFPFGWVLTPDMLHRWFDLGVGGRASKPSQFGLSQNGPDMDPFPTFPRRVFRSRLCVSDLGAVYNLSTSAVANEEPATVPANLSRSQHSLHS